jgi:hypothetical protein
MAARDHSLIELKGVGIAAAIYKAAEHIHGRQKELLRSAL